MRGEPAIATNIIVVDAQGNEYGVTSPKRAKGLVKSGKARFIEENRICLASPSKTIREEETASEHIDKRAVFEQIAAVQNELTGIDKILCSI